MKPMIYLIAAVFTVLVGCSASLPPKELVDARLSFQQANAGSAGTLVPAELHKARTALDLAEKSFLEDPDSYVTIDLAYVADRKAKLAEALATTFAENKATEKAKKDYDVAQNEIMKNTADQLSLEQKARIDAEKVAADALADLAKLAAVKEEARGLVITLSGSVLFASNEWTLLPAAQDRLNRVAEALMVNKERELTIEGFTDSQGSSEHNMVLSQKRADVVRSYLISRGYPDNLIQANGIGEERPVANNTSAEGRANNRRVEIVVESCYQTLKVIKIYKNTRLSQKSDIVNLNWFQVLIPIRNRIIRFRNKFGMTHGMKPGMTPEMTPGMTLMRQPHLNKGKNTKMFNIKKNLFRLAFLIITIASSVALISCSDSTSPETGQGQIKITMIDAPAGYDEVNIVVTRVEVHKAGTDSVSGWFVINNNAATYDLLTLRNGASAILGENSLEVGHYTQIRLIIGSGSNVVVNGMTYPLIIPSGDQSGLKLNHQFEIQSDLLYELLLDFNADRSIVMIPNGQYKLKPVIRLIPMVVSGTISGKINPLSTAGYVYAISGSDTAATMAEPVTGSFMIMALPQQTYRVEVFSANVLYNDTTVSNVSVIARQNNDLGTLTLSLK